MKSDLNSNTCTRLSLVLCVDISPSMALDNRMQNLDSFIQHFYDELRINYKLCDSVEVAIVTFSTQATVITDGFEYIGCMADKTFIPVKFGDSNLSGAMLKSIELLENRLQELDEAEIDHCIPCIIFVTDGVPDNIERSHAHNVAVEAFLRYCECGSYYPELIAPYFVSVEKKGERDYLDSFAKDFIRAATTIEGVERRVVFDYAFESINRYIVNVCLSGNFYLRSCYKNLRERFIRRKTEELIE